MDSIDLVLAGAGFDMFAYIGAMEAIEYRDIKIDTLTGTSAGAVISAFIASGYKARDIKQIAKELKIEDIKDPSLNIFDRLGYMRGDKIEKLFRKYLPKTIGELTIPTAIVTTNINKYEPEVYVSHTQLAKEEFEIYDPNADLADILRASMSLPLIFKMKKIHDNFYWDGGLTINYYINKPKTTKTIGIKTLTKKMEKPGNMSNPIQAVMVLIDIMISHIERKHYEDALHAKTITLDLATNSLTMPDETSIRYMIDEGYEQTKSQLSHLLCI